MSTFWYCLKQGITNICRNILFSLASIATISACIFLFCLFFALTANVRYAAEQAEATVGITVFFDESLPEDEIMAIGETILGWEEVKEIVYTSAEQAWENFKLEYFEGNESLAEGFSDDNPLAGSASYEVFLHDISGQEQAVAKLNAIEGVRRVRYSSVLVEGFTNMGKMVGALSAAIIGVLLAVAVFLISNTISVAAAFRRRENEIMRYIGATTFMVRAPFVVEGVLLGLFGALIPLGACLIFYREGVKYLTGHYAMITNLFTPLGLRAFYPHMAVMAISLGVGLGFIVSFFTIRKHLSV